jgi:flagellin
MMRPAWLFLRVSEPRHVTLERAALNVSDGLSAIQIIEGTLDAVGSLLSRMSERAAQTASGSLSSTKRSVLDREYQQLSAHIFRLKESRTFNGIQFLHGARAASRPAAEVVGPQGRAAYQRPLW